MKKCLIADNNEFYLEFFSDTLKNYGFEVDKAQDGLIALNLARREKYDLFVFDYIMPKIDGIRLARYIKSIPHYKLTPVILITAAALESLNTEDINNFADLLIAKGPFEKMREIFDEVIPNLSKMGDISDKKILGLADIYPRQIVKELLITELNHSAIFKNLIEGVVQLDENGKILFVNDSFCKYLNISEEEIVGVKIEDIFSFSLYPEVKNVLDRLIKERPSAKETIVINYEKKIFHLSFYNVLNRNDIYAGSFIIVQDVTELKNRINQITAIFNIAQAFLSNLPYKNVLEYVSYELRRLIKATDVSLILSCEGIFKGEVVESRDRKLNDGEIKKIDYWLERIVDWKKTGLVSVKNITKLSKLRFEDLSTLWLPLVFQNIYLGTLLGFKHSGSDFDEEESRFFEAVGNQIAVYLSNIEFFNRSEKEGKKSEDRKRFSPIENDIFQKHVYLKWETRQKKIAVQKMCEDFSRSLTLMEGYLQYFSNDSSSSPSHDREICWDKIVGSEKKLRLIREDFFNINNLGNNEATELYIFDLGMLSKRLRDLLPTELVEINGELIYFQKWGDFDKITFIIKKVVEELLSIGSNKVALSFLDEENKGVIAINGFFPAIDDNLKEVTRLINEESWNEVDNTLYFYLWHLKQIVNLLNSELKVSLEENKIIIKIILTT